MSSKGSSSLKELRGLREAVLAEEKAKAQARMQNLPDAEHRRSPLKPPEVLKPPAIVDPDEVDDLLDDDQGIVPLESEKPSIDTVPPHSQIEAEPDAPALPQTAALRNKPNKESALIIPLTPKILDRLKRNVENARWSPAQLVIELIQSTLHQGYPTIEFGDRLIARSGTYRTFERNPLENTLKISSGQGVFSLVVTLDNPDYQHWLSYFTRQKSADPEKSAQQICLFGLQSFLENVEDFAPDGWRKNISVEHFSIHPSV